MSNTIDEILMSLVEKVAPDEDGLSQHKGLEPQDLAEDKAIQTAKQDITQAMLDALPKKLGTKPEFLRSRTQARANEGYNSAITQMESAIKKMGENDA